jgi:Domain of unknown function (DUF4287)
MQEVHMSFQAYLDAIKIKTGKSPAEFKTLADKKGWMAAGILRSDVKAGAVIDWLNSEFNLGRGHAMAIVAVLKGQDGDKT